MFKFAVLWLKMKNRLDGMGSKRRHFPSQPECCLWPSPDDINFNETKVFQEKKKKHTKKTPPKVYSFSTSVSQIPVHPDFVVHIALVLELTTESVTESLVSVTN